MLTALATLFVAAFLAGSIVPAPSEAALVASLSAGRAPGTGRRGGDPIQMRRALSAFETSGRGKPVERVAQTRPLPSAWLPA